MKGAANHVVARRIWNNEKRTAMAIIAQYKFHELAFFPFSNQNRRKRQGAAQKQILSLTASLSGGYWVEFPLVKSHRNGIEYVAEEVSRRRSAWIIRTFGRFITWETALTSTGIDPLVLKNNYIDYILFPWYMYWVDPSRSPVRHLMQTRLTNKANLYFPAYFGLPCATDEAKLE